MKIAVTVSNFLADSDSDEICLESPYPGAVEFMRTLYEAGHTLIIYDCRVNDLKRCQALRLWLVQNFIEYTDIWVLQGKPEADVYLDPQSLSETEFSKILKAL